MRRIKQRDLAAAAGISVSQLGKIERGERMPSAQVLVTLVALLDCSEVLKGLGPEKLTHRPIASQRRIMHLVREVGYPLNEAAAKANQERREAIRGRLEACIKPEEVSPEVAGARARQAAWDAAPTSISREDWKAEPSHEPSRPWVNSITKQVELIRPSERRRIMDPLTAKRPWMYRP